MITVTTITSDAALFDLYFVHSASSLIKLMMTMAAVAQESFVGARQDRTYADNAILMAASCLVNRGVRIVKFDPHQSTEFDQRSTSAVHSNMHS